MSNLIQPAVIDIIKATLNISLQYPLCTCFLTQYTEAPFNSIGSVSTRSKSIGMDVALSFCHRFQCHQVECLHRTVMYELEAEGAFLPVLLGNIDTPQG